MVNKEEKMRGRALRGVQGPGHVGIFWCYKLTKKFQMFKLDLEKAEEPEINLPTSVGSLKKQVSFRKISTSASFTSLNPLTV